MSMKTKSLLTLALTVLSAFMLIFSSCKKTDAIAKPGNFIPDVSSIKNIQVILSGSGADFQTVMLDVQKVEIKEDLDDENQDNDNFAASDDNADDHLRVADEFGRWKTIDQTPQAIDILSLKNGAETLIGNETAMFKVRKIRITLGTNNYLVDNAGETHALRLENDVEKFIYISVYADNIDEDDAMKREDYHLYFDAANSIKEENGSYLLDPMVRPFSNKAYGELTGQVFPSDIHSMLTIEDGDGYTMTAVTENNGEFKVRGLKEGTGYKITVKAANFVSQEFTGITMERGRKTQLDAITLIK